jgi:hypothetical protein
MFLEREKMAKIITSSGPIVAVIGETNIIAIYAYDRDGNPVALSNAYKCILTVRATENATSYLFRTFGEIEVAGNDKYPGVITFVLYPSDTKDIAPGDYWYDAVILTKGDWFSFDINRYKENLVFVYKEGKIKVNGVWKKIPEGYLNLTDNSKNFIELDPETLEITANTTGFTEGKIKLFRLRTDNGKIITKWPGNWFSQGNHSGLNFYYNSGKVLTKDLDLIEVPAGYITLQDNETNYIEVDDNGNVSSNIYNFNPSSHPLYIATTKDGEIVKVEKIDDVDAIVDERSVFIRGDEIIWASKDIFQLQAGITKPTELEV